jgi:uncharacterized protein YjbJ (UPF0337 family)
MGRAFYTATLVSVSSRTDASAVRREDGVAGPCSHGVPAQSQSIHLQKDTMNKDQIKGTVKDLAGKVQEAAGKTLDNKEMELKGVQKQVLGTAEKALGDAKQGAHNASEAVKRAFKTP